jgi:hypothetical protein
MVLAGPSNDEERMTQLRAPQNSSATQKPRFNRKRSERQASQAIRRAVCESLEERQMMTLTVEVRSSGGGTSATVTSVGQVINLEVLALVTDAQNMPSEDGLEDVGGSFISNASDGHAVAGNLAAANIAPFEGLGLSPGKQQDLNGDGNIDVGTDDPINDSEDLFYARATRGSALTSTDPSATIVGNALEFEIGTLSYTVTSLNEGGTTDINFVPGIVQGTGTYQIGDAAWYEDDQAAYTAVGYTFQAGTPFSVSDDAIIPAPTAVNSSFNVVRNTPTTIDQLAVDNIVEAINPNTVVIVSPPAHGTATPITSGATAGQILYTPTAGYTGTDSFTYKMSDVDGRTSGVATVSITVVLPPPPTAGNVTDTTFRNSPVTVNVLSSDSSVGTLMPGTVAVASPPADGTAVAQSNGTIVYTPASGFTGTDTFTYTVADSNQETSAAGTVTITVAIPTPPTADDFTSTAYEGTPTTIDISSEANASSGTLALNTIAIVTAPLHGTAVPQTDGTVLYTPTPGYIGADSFVYTIDDSLGDVSGQATDTITVAPAPPPVGSDVVVPVVTGVGNTINVLSNVSSGAPLVPGSVTVVTAPLHGTASVNASTGLITYTPNAGFVGEDTLSYSVGDVNLDTSTPATVSLNVGATLSSAKGAAHSITFTNPAGGSETVTLNLGSAQLFFNNGTGTFVVAKNGKGTVSGAGLGLTGITLSGTTKASSLVIKGTGKAAALSIPGITDASPLKSITAQNSTISGAVTLNGANSVTFGTVTDATMNVSGGYPGSFSLTAGNVTNSTLLSKVAVATLKVASWSDSATVTGPAGAQISVPSIGTLIDAGAFGATVALAPVTAKIDAIASGRITGALSGSLNTSAGSTIGTLTVGAVASAWAGVVGNLNSFTVKGGGLAADLTTAALGTLVVNGGLTGNIRFASAKTIRIVGNVTGSTITGATLTSLSVTGTLADATLTTSSGIGTLSVGSINGSNVSAGVTSGTTVSNATAANLGSSTIGTLHSGSYINSDVLAGKINSASLGAVSTSNGGTAFGVASGSINALSGVFSTTPAHFAKAQLVNEEVFQAYAQKLGTNFADFGLQILG